MEKTKKGTIWLSGILITLLLLAMGLLFDSVVGQFSWFKPTWPQNLYFYLVLLVVGMAVGIITEKVFIKQLASFPAFIPSLVVLASIGVALIFDPLAEEIPFLSYVKGLSATLMLIYVVVISGVAIILIGKKYSGWNKMFAILPLIGYLVFVMATVNGQYDYYHMTMIIGKDRAIFEGRNHDGRALRTPFALKLMNLELPDQEVDFALRKSNSEDLSILESVPFSQSGLLNLGDYEVKVEQFLPRAVSTDSGFVSKDTINCVQAAMIIVLKGNEEVANGWVTSGSSDQMPLSLNINNNSKISILYSQDQKYVSQVRIFDTVSKYDDHILSPGQTQYFKGWEISVHSFDPRFGESSPLLVMDLVFDRWVEAKYIGLVILLLGLIGLYRVKK
ncbi:hypothetical protein [Carboxylicivirga linearis]|uniref:ResB-like domain-containing protein n=1 Tax=Carboxylicivirga linearis TaxID=1628157 RepID=A0ABS5JYG2_9BACT|nr:hypothetical protein [Carboxylicivirga linearis]MBS2099898.1 hypothetical protein [Carboxylicivirga linearis]